jgi:type IX secretion system PorP/SprF family membrane protein
MKTILKIPLLLLPTAIGIFLPLFSSAQDIHFSQFYLSPQMQNPALVGSGHDMQALLNYKDQWRSVASPYKTIAASFDMKLNKKNKKKGFCAAGVSFFSDRAGDSKMGITQANFSFAYHVHVNDKNTLGGAMTAGFAQRSINYSNLQWANQFDGFSYNSGLSTGETQGSNSFTYPDIGAGILWAYRKSEKYMTGNDQRTFNFGVALFHINQPKYSYYSTPDEKLHRKLVLHGEGLIGIPNTNFSLVPGFMFYQQGTQREIYAGTMFKYMMQENSKYTGYVKGSALSLGAYYRYKDAIAITSLFEFSNYAIGISYDINTSKLATASSGRGGLEIALRFMNPNPFIFKSMSIF